MYAPNHSTKLSQLNNITFIVTISLKCIVSKKLVLVITVKLVHYYCFQD